MIVDLEKRIAEFNEIVGEAHWYLNHEQPDAARQSLNKAKAYLNSYSEQMIQHNVEAYVARLMSYFTAKDRLRQYVIPHN